MYERYRGATLLTPNLAEFESVVGSGQKDALDGVVILVADDEIDEDPVLAPYSRLEEDNSYYICGVALYPEYRGKGIGHQFMALAKKQAMLEGIHKLSLIVFEDNEKGKLLLSKLEDTFVKRSHLPANQNMIQSFGTAENLVIFGEGQKNVIMWIKEMMRQHILAEENARKPKIAVPNKQIIV